MPTALSNQQATEKTEKTVCDLDRQSIRIVRDPEHMRLQSTTVCATSALGRAAVVISDHRVVSTARKRFADAAVASLDREGARA